MKNQINVNFERMLTIAHRLILRIVVLPLKTKEHFGEQFCPDIGWYRHNFLGTVFVRDV